MRFILYISVILIPFIWINFNSTGEKHQIQFNKDPDTTYFNSIKKLDLSQSDLRELPLDISLYKNLEELDLSNNPIEKLDVSIFKLKKLRTLHLNNCPHIDIDNVIDIIKNLKIETLELSNCFLTYIPSQLTECKSLKKLILKENFIERFPDELALYGRLNWLDLSNNNLDSLPSFFDAMKWLNYLDLSYNDCLSHRESFKLISGLQNLETLNIKGTGNITDDLNELVNLKTLVLSQSKITEIPAKLYLPRLRSLIANKCDQLNYTEFFKSVSSMDSIENLELSSPNLTKLSDEISKLHQLTSLVIGENNLKELPKAFEKLENLKSLKIQLTDQNQANSIFETINKCEQLEILDVSYSTINTIPSSIGKLKNLKLLNIEGMSLKKIPSDLASLKNLEELNLKGNNFEITEVDKLSEKLLKCKISVDRPYSVPDKFKNEMQASKQSFTINSTISNTISTIDGSIIRIPANAFIDQDGKSIKGDIVIDFQPFYSPAQIYLSGINMNYDSSGVNQSFISAGMFNISANSGEKVLSLNKQKKIQIDFSSNDPETNYNYYKFNAESKKWNYKGVDNIKPRPKKEDSTLKLLASNTRGKRIKRMPRPQMNSYRLNQNTTRVFYEAMEMKGRRKYAFWIERGFQDPNIHDEIPNYINSNKNWIYEPDSTNKDLIVFTKKDKIKMFHKTSRKKRFGGIDRYLEGLNKSNIDIDVYPDRSKDRFTIVFRSKNDSVILTGYPDYRSSASKVQVQTKKDYETYLEAKKKRQKQESDLLEKYMAELKVYEAQMREYRAYLRKQNAEEISKLNNKPVSGDRIIRSLQLDELGTWNCDIINRLPNGMEIFVRFYDKNKRVSPSSITVIDKTNNGFASFGTSKIIVDCFVNTIVLMKVDGDKYGYVKFAVSDKTIRTLDLAINIVDTKNMTMKEFTDQVFN